MKYSQNNRVFRGYDLNLKYKDIYLKSIQNREEFWKNVANDPNLSKQFKPQNISLMKKGKAPIASDTQWIGKVKNYQLHHKILMLH